MLRTGARPPNDGPLHVYGFTAGGDFNTYYSLTVGLLSYVPARRRPHQQRVKRTRDRDPRAASVSLFRPTSPSGVSGVR